MTDEGTNENFRKSLVIMRRNNRPNSSETFAPKFAVGDIDRKVQKSRRPVFEDMGRAKAPGMWLCLNPTPGDLRRHPGLSWGEVLGLAQEEFAARALADGLMGTGAAIKGGTKRLPNIRN